MTIRVLAQTDSTLEFITDSIADTVISLPLTPATCLWFEKRPEKRFDSATFEGAYVYRTVTLLYSTMQQLVTAKNVVHVTFHGGESRYTFNLELQQPAPHLMSVCMTSTGEVLINALPMVPAFNRHWIFDRHSSTPGLSATFVSNTGREQFRLSFREHWGLHGELAVTALEAYFAELIHKPDQWKTVSDALESDAPIVEDRLYKWMVRKKPYFHDNPVNPFVEAELSRRNTCPGKSTPVT